tara:strand:+ start:169 stop:681 length:513 start_codon:yes stop_codon:yes gene_type:complete
LSKLHVNEINAKGSANTGLSINDTGRVTTPNKIAFLAVGNNNAYVTTSPIVVPVVRHNFGNGYDASTGKFTVPTGGAGLYWFHLHMGIVYTTSGGGNCYPNIKVYSAADVALYTPYTYWNQADAADYGSCHITVTYNLDEGDYVYLTFYGSNAKYYAGVGELNFQGMRMG